MRTIGYIVLINRAHPDKISYTKEEAIAIAKELRPAAERRIKNDDTDSFCTSQLASWFASTDRESRDEILTRVRKELELHWKESKKLMAVRKQRKAA